MTQTENTSPENLSKADVLEAIFSEWDPSPDIETVSLAEAYGRVLAEDQFALYNLPVVRASSMDGVAVDSKSFKDGMPDTSAWIPGEDFVRADTGDDFDDAFDSVIRIEDVDIDENGRLTIHLPESTPFEPGMNVRPAGSSLKKGALLAPKNHTLGATDLSTLCSGGIAEAPVIKKPRVAFIPTGSELVSPGTRPERGQNIESNSLLAKHLILEMGGEPVCYPIVKDKKDELASAVEKALSECDIVLISGGSSKGEEDFNTKTIEAHGHMICHWVKAAPGRPMGIAMAGNKPLINLSGPSFAAFYGIEWCLRPLIARFLGLPAIPRQKITVTLENDVHSPGIMEVLCMLNVRKQPDGTYTAVQQANRNTGNPALSADAMFATKLGVTLYKAGEKIQAELIKPLGEI